MEPEIDLLKQKTGLEYFDSELQKICSTLLVHPSQISKIANQKMKNVTLPADNKQPIRHTNSQEFVETDFELYNESFYDITQLKDLNIPNCEKFQQTHEQEKPAFDENSRDLDEVYLSKRGNNHNPDYTRYQGQNLAHFQSDNVNPTRSQSYSQYQNQIYRPTPIKRQNNDQNPGQFKVSNHERIRDSNRYDQNEQNKTWGDIKALKQ